MEKNKGIDILSLEAKDIYISNEYYDRDNGVNVRYRTGNNMGDINLKKFTNTLDYSLELPKINEIYEKKYRNRKFYFERNGHNYSTRIINVTYSYSVKEWNKEFNNTYVKLGHIYNNMVFDDCVCIENGIMIGIQTEEIVNNPVPQEMLGEYFYYDNQKYHIKDTIIPTVVDTLKLRDYTYRNGFKCDGVEYVRYKRSGGASRIGKCLFIDKNLYNGIKKWQQCGLKIRDGQGIDLAAYEAYIALPLSSIIDTIEIRPENILLIDDYVSVFKEKVIETIDINNRLTTRDNEIEIKNSIWDGQSLIDISIMDKYKNKGMLLLRNRFFKSCCFNSNIQKWFKDNNITDVSQLNGKTKAKKISDIKLITTPSSIKYLKFGTFEEWLDNIDDIFGIVKYEKPTYHFDGNIVQTHYQLLNTLQLSEKEVAELLKDSFDFLDRLKSDPAVLRYFIKYPINIVEEITPAMSKNDITFKLLGINNKFSQTKIYDDFKKDVVKSQIKMMRSGKIYVEGNYSTLCGNPIEMLQQSINTFDGEQYIQKNTISSKRFKKDEELLGTRSPHVCEGCILVTTNKQYDLIDKYMNGTNEIVYINSIKENILNRLSGSDFDSDTLLLTNNKILLKAAKRNYNLFKVSVCNVSSKKKKRKYTTEEKVDLDFKTSVNKIGEIVNLAAIINSKMWDLLNTNSNYQEVENMYFDICQLNAMSGIEIDSAKKEFEINNVKELDRIRNKYLKKDNNGKLVKPYFFKFIQQYKGFYNPIKHNYLSHKTTMDFIEHEINKYQKKRKDININGNFIKFYQILNMDNYSVNRVHREQVARIVRLIKNYKNTCSAIALCDFIPSEVKYRRIYEERQKVIEYIGNLKFNKNTMIYMLKILDNKQYQKEYRMIFEFLFGYPNSSFYELIKESNEQIQTLEFDKNGNITMLNLKYSYKNLQKTSKNQ